MKKFIAALFIFSLASTAFAAPNNNQLNKKIKKLTARVVAMEKMSTTSVVGRTYSLSQVNSGFFGDGKGTAVVYNGASSMTLTLKKNATFRLLGTEDEAEMTTSNAGVSFDDSSFEESGTYTQVGNIVTLDFKGGDTVDLQVALNGSIILGSGSQAEKDDEFDEAGSYFVMGVETKK
jgi:hypothetical protein